MALLNNKYKENQREMKNIPDLTMISRKNNNEKNNNNNNNIIIIIINKSIITIMKMSIYWTKMSTIEMIIDNKVNHHEGNTMVMIMNHMRVKNR